MFFADQVCGTCGGQLGFVPDQRAMLVTTQQGSPEPAWSDGQSRLVRCANHALGARCNWLVDEQDTAHLCRACALNRTIPDLSNDECRARWAKLEAAKRRLVYGIDELGLPLHSKHAQPETGLAFDFLAPSPDNPVLTGHADGVVTLNLNEADPVCRERTRVELDERYRTLLGHFRHEIGHYYFPLLVTGESLDEFRELFGDEREDYAVAVERHYANGPSPAWSDNHISAYASMHPFEDWAEVWAHYLHMVDALETARANQLLPERAAAQGQGALDTLLADFQRLAVSLNEMNRSLGVADAYPFVISAKVRDKLDFVQRIIRCASAQSPAARDSGVAAVENPPYVQPASSPEPRVQA